MSFWLKMLIATTVDIPRRQPRFFKWRELIRFRTLASRELVVQESAVSESPALTASTCPAATRGTIGSHGIAPADRTRPRTGATTEARAEAQWLRINMPRGAQH